LGFAISNIEGVIEELKADGVQVSVRSDGSAFAVDPDGHKVDVSETG